MTLKNVWLDILLPVAGSHQLSHVWTGAGSHRGI